MVGSNGWTVRTIRWKECVNIVDRMNEWMK